MLFTAIAATVVILPWAVGSPAGHHAPSPGPGDTHLAQQPLIGLGGGVTVREISQATPFSMVALTGGDLTGTSARIRARHADGSWGQWYETETLTGHAGTTGPHGTDPVFVGKTTTVQISVNRPAGAPRTSAPKTKPAADLGYIPATAEQPLAQNISAILITPPQAPADTQWNPPTAAIGAGQAPNIIARAQWGADEAVHCGNRPFDQPIRAAVVHHTAESNDYQPQDSVAIMRSIYAYHTQILGWCDIAYNARRRQVRPGIRGPGRRTDRDPWQGDHTGGFNRDSWGVAMIGNFDDIAPTPIQLHTLGRLIGWRLGLDNINPMGTVALPSAGGENTNFPFNAVATLPTVFSPPRCRRHRLPRQRRVRPPRRDPGNGSAFQRPTPARRPDPGIAGRRHLRPVAGHRRPQQRPGRAHLAGRRPAKGTRATRTSRRARCTGRRQPARRRSPAPSTTRGPHSASNEGRWACRRARNSKSRNGSSRTSSTAR